MIEFLSDLDTQLLLAVNGFNAPPFDRFMMLVSHKFVWIPFYALFVVLLMRRYGWRTGLVMVAGAVLTLVLSDQICATFIRPYAARLRPANLENPISGLVHIVDHYRGGRYGFPSCHAANTFGFVAFMALAFGRQRLVTWMLIIWALLNCWSRMYLGVHYPGDLLCGALIGALCGVAVFMAIRWGYQRIMPSSLQPDVANTDVPASKVSKLLSPGRAVAAVEIATLAILLAVSLIDYATH